MKQKKHGGFNLTEPDIDDIEISDEVEFAVGLSDVDYTKAQKHILDIANALNPNITVEFVDGLESNGKYIRSQNKILIKSDLSTTQMYVEVLKHEFMRMNEFVSLQDNIYEKFSVSNNLYTYRKNEGLFG